MKASLSTPGRKCLGEWGKSSGGRTRVGSFLNTTIIIIKKEVDDVAESVVIDKLKEDIKKRIKSTL